MQYLKYPTKVMNITQNYSGTTSHSSASLGSPKSYPIDDNCGNAKRSNFYAPCDLKIKRIYGVGNAGVNAVWLESKEKVKLANNKESYVTKIIVHGEDEDLKKLKVGKVFKQGEYLFKEGRDGFDRGFASGYHFHIEVATCKFEELENNGWRKNSKGSWVISRKAIKPEDAFYVDSNFTTIKDSGGLQFKMLPKEKDEYYPKSNYQGTSITTALNQLKIDSSFANREKIANKNGISNYRGTSTQNTKLLNLVQQGVLKKI